MLLLAIVGYTICKLEPSDCASLSTKHVRLLCFLYMLARQSETRCQMNLEIRTALIVLNGFRKQLCSDATSVTSSRRIRVFSKEMRYINLRFKGQRNDQLVVGNPSQNFRSVGRQSPAIWDTQCYLPPDTGERAPH